MPVKARRHAIIAVYSHQFINRRKGIKIGYPGNCRPLGSRLLQSRGHLLVSTEVDGDFFGLLPGSLIRLGFCLCRKEGSQNCKYCNGNTGHMLFSFLWGRVGMWRGSVGSAYLFPALSSAGASIAGPCSVSTPRSSNRTCRLPASGSRTRSYLRPRKAARARYKAGEPICVPETLVRESHVVPGRHLVLTTQPLAQPPGRVPVHRGVGRAHLAQDEVVRPPGHEPVEATYHHLRGQQSGPPARSAR